MTQPAKSKRDGYDTWASEPVTVPASALLRAYGALGAAAHHLRNLPATSEGDDARIAELCQRAYDAISEIAERNLND